MHACFVIQYDYILRALVLLIAYMHTIMSLSNMTELNRKYKFLNFIMLYIHIAICSYVCDYINTIRYL